jgi:hypothetical protein
MRLNTYLPVDENAQSIGLAYKDQVTKLDYNASGSVQYIGKAEPGASVASSVWQIKKFLYDSDYKLSSIAWASGSIDFAYVWNDRAGLVYL